MTFSTPPSSLPPKVPGNFLLGQLLEAKNEGVYFYLRMKKEHGDAIRLRFAHQNIFLFLNPDYNREVLVDKSDQFIKGKQYDSLRLLMGKGLLTSVGEEWAIQRRMLNPLFGREGMDVLLAHIDRISKKYSVGTPLNAEINWTKYMFDFTLEVAFASFFGTNFSDKQLDQLVEASYDCVRFVSKRMSNFINPPLFLPLKEHRRFRKSFAHLKETVEGIYNSRVQNPDAPSNDLLDLLMKAEDTEREHQKLSRDEIWDQILSFMIAGHETTALTMSWLFYHLAKSPETQEKIAEEGARNNYQFDHSLALSQYPYLSAVLNEILRLYPAGWILARTAAQDSAIGEFKIKKGQVIAVSPLVTQRDPRWWKDPDEFVPERFLEGHALIHRAPKNAFIPFSIGKRNCIGSRFALLEMALFCLHFFKEHRVHSTQGEVRMKAYITLKSDKHIKLTVKKISSSI
ncbi:MAG: cytochrome P450 [Bacteriovorax sp.]